VGICCGGALQRDDQQRAAIFCLLPQPLQKLPTSPFEPLKRVVTCYCLRVVPPVCFAPLACALLLLMPGRYRRRPDSMVTKPVFLQPRLILRTPKHARTFMRTSYPRTVLPCVLQDRCSHLHGVRGKIALWAGAQCGHKALPVNGLPKPPGECGTILAEPPLRT